MENLRLTHDAWYALPKWERDIWLAREMDKNDKYNRLLDSMIDKSKRQLKSPHMATAAYWLQGQMV